MRLKNKVAINSIGVSTANYGIKVNLVHQDLKIKKTLTTLHNSFLQSNFQAGIQNTASSICGEYRSSLQNETGNLDGNPSAINEQYYLINKTDSHDLLNLYNDPPGFGAATKTGINDSVANVGRLINWKTS